jgi:hypothetical protein
MKFNFLILFIFLFSCTTNYTKSSNKIPYNSKGFAYVYNQADFEKKIIKNKLNNNQFIVSHQNLKTGTLLQISNPKTKDSIVLTNIRKIQYPDFYKILITEAVAEKLNIDYKLPLIEILEVKKNKKFIAKKAKIYKEEKKIPSNAPVTSVHISNISKKKKNFKVNHDENIYILIASFYTKDTANFLKKRITQELQSYDNKKLSIKKKNSKKFDVLSGPYKSINLLKNDYINLKNFGFEELDIFIND